MTTLRIAAPLDGWCAGLDEVPDEVFAGRLLGDGLAIDPTSGILRAPCAGEIINVPASAHAVSMRTHDGIEILMHIGIDTVGLQGRGFESCVKAGARVETGSELIRFDLDIVARGAKSLMTPIVISPVDGMRITRRHAAGMLSAGDLLFEIHGAPTEAAVSPPQPAPRSPGDATATRRIRMDLRQGLHARPAALIVRSAKTVTAKMTLGAHGRVAPAQSVVALMALGVRHGDELTIHASGQDAEIAVAGVVAALQEAVRMEASAPHPASPPQPSQPQSPAATRAAATGRELAGIIASRGYAVGRATRIERREITVAEIGSGAAVEHAELDRARSEVRLRLQKVAQTGGPARRDIIGAHLEFLADPSLNETAQQLIELGKSAGFAWRGATRQSIAALQQLEDARLRERVDDLLDIEAHVLLALSGEARPMTLPLPEQAVLLAQDLLPSELTALDRQRLAGICLAAGGATSHVAILAAAMDIPMLVGLGSALHDITEGSTVIVDADAGVLLTRPAPDAVALARAAVEARRTRLTAWRSAARLECRAADGTRIEVFANLGNLGDALVAVENGAEGCGLLRTEFLFIDRDTAPTEDEQWRSYQEVAEAMGDRPVILRLMDVGGDKPLRYLPMPAEENPALGMRGVRTALARPALLRTQLRAALRVTPFGKLRILIPMVTDVEEILAVRTLAEEISRELRIEGRAELGAMIETPAAALTAAGLSRHVDFMSIGTNDLTQYALAMDRGHPDLARRADALHPAVLRLISLTAGAGLTAGKLVAVCGGIAADPAAIPLLLGLGVREVSVVPAAVPGVKRLIRTLNVLDCRSLAQSCLELKSAAEVRALVSQSIKPLGEAS